MSEPYLGEIRMFAGNFAPYGWALCNGQQLNIAEYEALYTLLGNTYGGDGQTTFAVPDLQGRVPLHPNTTYPLAAKGGSETVTLMTTQMPAHTHVPNATSVAGNQPAPTGLVWSSTSSAPIFSDGTGLTPVPMNGQTISSVGGGQPHSNMMPTLTVSFIIALEGVFPPQP